MPLRSGGSEYSTAEQRRAEFLSALTWEAISERLKLSTREAQISKFVLENCSEIEIANQLLISPHTVHSHLERLYRKLRIQSRCGLIVCIFEAYVQLQERQVTLLDRSGEAISESSAL
jgi:DNA-binding CsgD family transcriptional regulator